MAKKKQPSEQQTLFVEIDMRSMKIPTRRASPKLPAAKDDDSPPRRDWNMPEPSGTTVAEVRLRWNKRLTPAQVARVESELGALPRLLGKLGFGAVLVERTFVRRRQK
jgi:hypothetical protein